LFVAWRKIVNGYEGYEYPPKFSDAARDILKDKEKGKEEFAKYYGDYYVKGCVTGASMKIVIRTVATSSSSSNTMDIDFKAAWNAGLFSIGGGFAFGEKLQASNTYSLDSVEVYYSGQDRGTGIRSLTVAEADAELTNFASIAKTGAPLFCIIDAYENLPDYIAIITTTETTTTTTSAAAKAKTFKDFLNDILYSKLVQLEVIMQWYLDATKK